MALKGRSVLKLAGVHHSLVAVVSRVARIVDCQVLEGKRGQQRQNDLFAEGRSKVCWPNSLHNHSPSRAVDVCMHPVNFEDRERATFFAGIVLGVSEILGVKIRWGGDWDRDFDVSDNAFDDLHHFELVSDE